MKIGLIDYPDILPSPQRGADGSIIAPDGTVVPPWAACPPNTAPEFAGESVHCVDAVGAQNLVWACGGMLSPYGTPGCEVQRGDNPGAPAPVAIYPPQAASGGNPPRLPWGSECRFDVAAAVADRQTGGIGSGVACAILAAVCAAIILGVERR